MIRAVVVVAVWFLAVALAVAAPHKRCSDGMSVTADTAGHCCWDGQAWKDGKCIGTPASCPEGYDKQADRCWKSDVVCVDGTEESKGHCCWPGQAWSTTRKVCVGIPTKCFKPLVPYHMADCTQPTDANSRDGTPCGDGCFDEHEVMMMERAKEDGVERTPQFNRRLPNQLDKAAIMTGMSAVRPQIDACYAKYHQRGEAIVDMTITPDGSVALETLTPRSVFDRTPTEKCVLIAARKARFPEFRGAAQKVRWPIVFK
jgi:hypothetical protein